VVATPQNIMLVWHQQTSMQKGHRYYVTTHEI